MGVKISALPAASAINSADLLAIVQNGVTRHAAASLIKTVAQDGIETGTWTPVANSKTATARADGWYIKINDIVIAGFDISFTAANTSTDIYLSGLPFTPGGTSNYGAGGGMATGLRHSAYGVFSGFWITSGHIYPRQFVTSSGVASGSSSNMQGGSAGGTVIMTGVVCYTT